MPDPWSNQVVSQVIVGVPPNEQIEIASVGSAGAILFLSNNALENSPAEMIGEVVGSGGALSLGVVLAGPQATSIKDRVLIFLLSANQGATAGSVGEFIYSNSVGADTVVASFGSAGWQFAGGTALPLAVPTGYPLGGSPTTTQLAATVNSLIANLIAANIIT